MRPRHKAAENLAELGDAVVDAAASMRPRHKAAENVRADDEVGLQDRGASMRPRHKAAENAEIDEAPLSAAGLLQ